MSNYFPNRRILASLGALSLSLLLLRGSAIPQAVTATAPFTYLTLLSSNVCASSVTAPNCGAAPAGFVVIANSAQTVVVTTSAATLNSQIFVQFDESLGAALGVTCAIAPNPETNRYFVSGVTRSAGSFTIKSAATISGGSPACLSYFIVN